MFRRSHNSIGGRDRRRTRVNRVQLGTVGILKILQQLLLALLLTVPTTTHHPRAADTGGTRRRVARVIAQNVRRRGPTLRRRSGGGPRRRRSIPHRAPFSQFARLAQIVNGIKLSLRPIFREFRHVTLIVVVHAQTPSQQGRGS